MDIDASIDCDFCDRVATFHLPSDDNPSVTVHLCDHCLEGLFNKVMAGPQDETEETQVH